jgi:chromosome segregation ATPase
MDERLSKLEGIVYGLSGDIELVVEKLKQSQIVTNAENFSEHMDKLKKLLKEKDEAIAELREKIYLFEGHMRLMAEGLNIARKSSEHAQNHIAAIVMQNERFEREICNLRLCIENLKTKKDEK